MGDTRPGRPPKVDEEGIATRDRLLRAAVDSCVEHGFDGATVADIAARAEVSAPAIYNHFGGKVELLAAAGRAALSNLAPHRSARPAAADVVRLFLSDQFRATRRLLVELHTAASRHPELAAVLADWHAEQAARWARTSADGRNGNAVANPDEVVKTFFALLLGLCHIDSLGALSPSAPSLVPLAEALVAVLFP